MQNHDQHSWNLNNRLIMDRKTLRRILEIPSRRASRPAQVDLLGHPAKAKILLGWSPNSDFDNLVTMMTDADLVLSEREKRANG